MRGGNERLLLVDDDPSIIDMLRYLFGHLGYQVTAEMDSLTALDRFRSCPEAFDLVLTDQTMPKMTGEQLAKSLLAIRPDIPIILSTGFSARIDDQKATAMGIKGFAMKPFTHKDIADRVRALLDETKNNHAAKSSDKPSN